MARAPSRSRYSLFGHWTPTTMPNGRVVWRQVLAQSPIPDKSGIGEMEPYAPMSQPKGGMAGVNQPNYSPDPRINAQFSTRPWPMPRSEFTRRELQFLREIGEKEGADYDSAFGMRNGKSRFSTPEEFSGKKLTDMTLDEVFAYQDVLGEETKKAGYGVLNGKVVGTNAVGRGQFVKGTLRDTLADLRITDFANTRFAPELQDRLIIANAKLHALDPNQVERWDAEKKAKLGDQWESLDVSKGKISPEDLEDMITRIRAQNGGRPPKSR